ncbi:MAG: aquaporin [Gemmatimonadales bacterium]
MRAIVRPLVAEFFGTFALIFVGAGSIIMEFRTNGGVGLVGIALAHGVVLSVWVTAGMRISGAHYNPAITFALWMSRHIDGKGALRYVGAQLAGAVTAALVLSLLFPSAATIAADLGVPRLASGVDLTRGILIEALLTFFLVSAMYGTVVSSEAPSVGGFGVGLALFFSILAAGPLTGGALNPARAFGPALVAGAWHGHIAYWIGPALGAAVASLIWSKVLLPLPSARIGKT